MSRGVVNCVSYLILVRPYSKISITRPGHSRLLEFEKKNSTGCLIETFSKDLDQEV